jgi:Domain of unknown function (DUF4349)
MRMKNVIGFSLMLALLALGCDSNESESTVTARTEGFEVAGEADYGTPEAMTPPEETRAGRGGDRAPEGAQALTVQVPDHPTSSVPRPRMVIKSATFQCEVADYDKTFADIQRITEQAGGYVVASTVHNPDAGTKGGTVMLRIPSDHFEATLQDLKSLASTVETETIEGNDITEEFYDLTARLDNKLKAEKRFQEILRSAKTSREILEVERALMDVREDVERLEGRKRFLADQTDLSTIRMSMHEPRPLMVAGTDKFWTRFKRGLAEGLEAGIVRSVHIVSTGVALVVAAVPFVIGLSVIYWGGRKYYRRKHAAAASKPSPSSLT